MTLATHTRSILLALALLLGVALPVLATNTDLDGAVHVTWAPSPSADVIGYHVYRTRNPQGAGFTRLTGEPVADLRYVDTTVRHGETYYYAATAVDSRGRESDLAQCAESVNVYIDVDAPMVLTHAPFAGQGLSTTGLDTRRPVPADSGLFVRLWDEGGVDLTAVSVSVLVNGQPVNGETTLHPVATGDRTDVFVRFVPAQRFPFDARVNVGVDATDVVGNGMATYQFAFKIESAAQNAAADAAAPAAVRTQLEDGTQVLQIATATATIPAVETQFVSFGEGESFGAWAHLDQIQFYAAPVSLRIPLTGRERMQAHKMQVLRYDESTQTWTVATVGDGWLASLSVVNGAAELQVAHSGAIALSFGR